MDILKRKIDDIENKVSQKYEGTEYKDSYVAFLDIIGMSNIIEKDYSFVRSIFNTIESAIILYGRISVSGNPFIGNKQVSVTIMSDSIVLSANIDVRKSLSKILGICSYIIKRLILNPPSPVFIRGGITKGKIFHSDGIVFGPGLVKAYHLENDRAEYMRCIYDPDLEHDHQFKEYISSDSSALDVDPKDDIYFVDFITDENREILRNHADKFTSHNIEDKIRDKYEWLIEHINSAHQ